jgi:uncharacterized membrane protein
MSRLLKSFWLLSLVLFLIVLLYVYAYLPASVGVHAGPDGRADHFIEKSSFFYLSIGLFLLANAAIFILRKLLLRTWLRDTVTSQLSPARIGMRKDVIDWLYAFATTLNVFFILIMVFMAAFNTPDQAANQGISGALVYAGPLLIGIVFLALIYIFVKKREE